MTNDKPQTVEVPVAELEAMLAQMEASSKPGALVEMLLSHPPIQAVPYNAVRRLRYWLAAAQKAASGAKP